MTQPWTFSWSIQPLACIMYLKSCKSNFIMHAILGLRFFHSAQVSEMLCFSVCASSSLLLKWSTVLHAHFSRNRHQIYLQFGAGTEYACISLSYPWDSIGLYTRIMIAEMESAVRLYLMYLNTTRGLCESKILLRNAHSFPYPPVLLWHYPVFKTVAHLTM